MRGRATVIATVESDHTVKVPVDMPVGEQVIIVPMPPIKLLTNDASRRACFAETHAAAQKAIVEGYPQTPLSNQEIVALVKRARKTTPIPD